MENVKNKNMEKNSPLREKFKYCFRFKKIQKNKIGFFHKKNFFLYI